MKLIGALGLKGGFWVRQYRDGEMIAEEWVDNTITTVGKGHVSGLINDQESTHFKWLALGDSSTAAAAGDTALANEVTANGCARAAATCTQVTTDDTDDTAQLVHTWTASGTQTIKECGVFNTSTQSGGDMLARQTFTAKNLENSDTLEITYKIDVD